jgi:hypothetical protein
VAALSAAIYASILDLLNEFSAAIRSA